VEAPWTVETVKMTLQDPSFTPNEHELGVQEDGAFGSRTFCGFSTFSVELELRVGGGRSIKITHELSFDQPETWRRHELLDLGISVADLDFGPTAETSRSREGSTPMTGQVSEADNELGLGPLAPVPTTFAIDFLDKPARAPVPVMPASAMETAASGPVRHVNGSLVTAASDLSFLGQSAAWEHGDAALIPW